MTSEITRKINRDTGVSLQRIDATIQLVQDGATIPFIARYRKDETGNLDEARLREIGARYLGYGKLVQRRTQILAAIEALDRMTPEVRERIETCENSNELEDLYLPYRPKRQSKANLSRRRGLEPLADYIHEHGGPTPVEDVALRFIGLQKKVPTVAEAIEGALYIVAEKISEDPDYRQWLRGFMIDKGTVQARAVKGKEDQKTKYSSYYNFSEPVARIPSHRMLAIRRGTREKILSNSIQIDDEKALAELKKRVEIPASSPTAELVGKAIVDAYERLLKPVIQNEVRIMLRERSEDEAIHVFRENLSALLLAPAAGAITVVGIDPNVKGASKLAVVNGDGTLAESHTLRLADPKPAVVAPPRETAPRTDEKSQADAAAGPEPKAAADAPPEASEGSTTVELEATGAERKSESEPVAEVPAPQATTLDPPAESAAEPAEIEPREPVDNDTRETDSTETTATSTETDSNDTRETDNTETTIRVTKIDNSGAARFEAPRPEPKEEIEAPAETTDGSTSIDRETAGAERESVSEPVAEVPAPQGTAPVAPAESAPEPAKDEPREPVDNDTRETASVETAATITETDATTTETDATTTETAANGALETTATETTAIATGEATATETAAIATEIDGSGTAKSEAPGPEPKEEIEAPAETTDGSTTVDREAAGAERESESEPVAEVPAPQGTAPDAPAESAPDPAKEEPREPVDNDAREPASVETAATSTETAATAVRETTNTVTAAIAAPKATATETAARTTEIDGSGTAKSAAAGRGTGRESASARQILIEILNRTKAQGIAICNSTGSRQAESFIRSTIREHDLQVFVVLVNEAGAGVYGASRHARQEFPNLDVASRKAVSIARRLQDPLAELVKVDPKSIGVGQYQHDVDQKLLEAHLESAVESAVHRVGVDPNSASPDMLRYVSGFSNALAETVVGYRSANGPFSTIEDLRRIEGVDERVFAQAAGFLKIKNGAEALDRSFIHPESYPIVRKLAESIGSTTGDLVGNYEKVRSIEFDRFEAEVGRYRLGDIRRELATPGRDPRKAFAVPRFRDDVSEVADLKEGMELEGTVTNVTNFGAFVDVGVRQDGLVHISELSHRYISDPRQAVQVGDVVKVKVIGVDSAVKRISLSVKAALPKPQRDARRQMPARTDGRNQSAPGGGRGRPQRPRTKEGAVSQRKRQRQPGSRRQEAPITPPRQLSMEEKIRLLQEKFKGPDK